MTKRVYLDSIGCRLNQSEISSMSRQFESLGYQVVSDPAQAEMMVVNTCAVTADATKDSRKLVRQLQRQSTQAEIAVTGCYAHIAPDSVAALPNVKFVVDNFQKEGLVAQMTGQTPEPYDLEPIQRHYQAAGADLTRAYVKVQDGCDNQCTFCVTRIARGAGRSRAAEEIVREVQWLTDSGYQEVVLTGVHLGSYGHDLGQHWGLYDLIQTLLQATTIPRIRLSSLEPWDLSPDFFSLWQNPRLCRHLHLPLQSGSDATLKRMRRNTSQAEFARLVDSARAQIPSLALSTDVIVGFPGEDEAEFDQSYAFIQAMDFMKIHVFPYSAREGTPAARMKGRVEKSTAKERLHQLQALSDSGLARFSQAHVGQTLLVVWEHIRGASEAGFWHTGLTDNYLRVEMTHPQVYSNHLTLTHLTHILENGAMGGNIIASVG